MKPTDTFSIRLTDGELSWLARVLGYVFVPLLSVDPNRFPDTAFETAPAQLLEKGLITYDKGHGWTVDRSLLVIMEVVANPDAVLAIQSRKRTGSSSLMFIYNTANFSLVVDDTSDWNFTFCSDPSSCLAQMAQCLTLPVKPEVASDELHVEDINLVIPLIWDSLPEAALATLIESGLSVEESNVILNFVRSMSNFATVMDVQIKDGDPQAGAQNCMLWNENALWYGTLQNQSANLRSISGEQIWTTLMMHEPHLQ